jgi:hypothetical protein
MTVQNEDLNLFTEQKFSPETIAVANIEGMGNVSKMVKGARKTHSTDNFLSR